MRYRGVVMCCGGARCLAVMAAVAVVVYGAPRAFAHHPTAAPAPQRGGDGAAAQTQVAFDLSTTEVDTPGADGTFVTAAVDLSLALGGGFAVRVRLPVHAVDASGFETSTGVGDAVVGGVWADRLGAGWIVSGGADLLVPTGDADRRLGYGAYALAGRGRVERVWDSGWRAAVVVGAVANLTDASEDIVADQRADFELRTGAGAGWGSRDVLARLDLVTAVPLVSQSARGRAFATAEPSMEVAAGPVWLRAFGALPLRATRRIDWRLGLGVAYRWEPEPSKRGSSLQLARAGQ